MEVFICTLSSGIRGKQEKGDALGQINLAKNSDVSVGVRHQRSSDKTKLQNYKNLITHYSLSTIHFFWVGGLVCFGLIVSVFLSVPHAHAADGLTNIELAKKVINEVAPIVSSERQLDVKGAALTLVAEDFIQKPLVVETEITVQTPKLKSVKKSVNTGGVHSFPYGYCTYYVSQKRAVIWSGNAGTWLKGAKSAGVKTGDDPRIGAIMVTNEGGSTGHVAYVEKVEDDLVTISEMNFKGFGIISSRTISIDSRFIKGYIY